MRPFGYAMTFIGSITVACGVEGSSDCVCVPQTALETPYDNSSSTLGAENVQDAVDELAARPVPEAPLRDRVYFTEWVIRDNLTTPNLVLGVACGPEIVVSVRCEYIGPAWPSNSAVPVLLSGGADDDQVTGTCIWSTHDGLIPTGTFRARALCLRL